jgi:superfamily II DNA or RNA helicase
MKYQLQYPKWMKHPAVYLNTFLNIPLDKIKMAGHLLIIDWDLDIVACEQANFIVEEFDEKVIVINIIGSLCQIVTHIDDFLNQELDQICSYEIPGKEFLQGKWDGIVHLYRYRTKKFPVGLLPTVKHVVERHLKGLGEIVITDERPEPKKIDMPDKLIGIELRDYQVDASNKGYEMGIGLVNSCVGSGKTEIACDLIRRFSTYTAFLVHRKELLYQAKERLESRLGIEVGQIGDGKIDIKPVTIMMFQALSRYIEDDKELMVKDSFKLQEDETEVRNVEEILQQFNNVIVDECSHVPSRTFYKVLTKFDNCRYRFGLSASPDRDDGQEMVIFAGVGSIIHKISASELIERGYLVKPTITMIKIPRSDNAVRGMPYPTVYKNYITENTVRNGRIVEEAYAMIKEGRKVLILVDRIKHGDIVKKMLEEYCLHLENPVNIRLAKVKGELCTTLRNDIMSKFKAGKLDCVIATASIYAEGVDIPIVSGLVIAGGGKSKSKTRQMVGRVLRTHPEKKDAKVIDCYDNAPYLSNHSKTRLETFWEETSFEVIVE